MDDATTEKRLTNGRTVQEMVAGLEAFTRELENNLSRDWIEPLDKLADSKPVESHEEKAMRRAHNKLAEGIRAEKDREATAALGGTVRQLFRGLSPSYFKQGLPAGLERENSLLGKMFGGRTEAEAQFIEHFKSEAHGLGEAEQAEVLKATEKRGQALRKETGKGQAR